MPLAFTTPDGPAGARVELSTPSGGKQIAVMTDVAVLGPTGPTGAAGPAGPTGPTGPSGAATPGSFRETFTGGNGVAITATSDNANIGECAWNMFITGSVTGVSVAKINGDAASVGVYKIISGTSATVSVFLGSQSFLPVDAAKWAECTWRCRFDTAQNAGELCGCGLTFAINQVLGGGAETESAAFYVRLNGASPPASANYQTSTAHSSTSEHKDTGVPVDGLFHDFRIVRLNAGQVDFYIDGVLRTSHTGQVPTGPLAPCGQAKGGGTVGGTFIDLDDFAFVPVP